MIKKCLKCGAMVEILQDCTCPDCGIVCCNQPMSEVKENSVDCAVEKHLPIVEKVDNFLIVSVPHVMENDHYIEYIELRSEKASYKKFLKPGDSAKAVFECAGKCRVSAMCNKHGLWSVEVE